MNSLHFEGKGLDLFKIRAVKFIVSILSLGLLHPWAKIKELKYLYSKSGFEGVDFSFEGDLKEYYKGYIKLWLTILLLMVFCISGGFLVAYTSQSLFANIIYSLTVILCTFLAFYITGLCINGTLTYRMKSTYWSGFNLNYSGKSGEFAPQFMGNYILTYLTAGLFTPWLIVNTLKYILPKIKMGNISFDFRGDGKKLFPIYLKGVLLTSITMGIYSIWMFKSIFEYIVSNLVIKKENQEINITSNANTLQVFELLVGNALIMIFTIGIGYSWAKTRALRFIAHHVIIPDGIFPQPAEYDAEIKEGPLNLIV